MKTLTKLNKSIDIRASRERIWQVLTGQEEFRDWASAFMPGSYYEGTWNVGDTLRFLGPSPDGSVGGMITKVVEHTPGEHILCLHYGGVQDGKDVFSGPEFEEWIGSTEEYRLTGGPDVHTLAISNDVPESFVSMFSTSWEQALARIKELAEA